MANDLIKICNGATGEEIEREMTAEEQAERNTQVETYLAEKAKKETEAAASAEAKAALLAKLGITADEAALLLG
jgi:hypothetical protein